MGAENADEKGDDDMLMIQGGWKNENGKMYMENYE